MLQHKYMDAFQKYTTKCRKKPREIFLRNIGEIKKRKTLQKDYRTKVNETYK